MINAFQELQTVIIHPHSPLIDSSLDQDVADDDYDPVMHCWKGKQDNRWLYCVLINHPSQGPSWCYSEFEKDLFPNMCAVLDGLVANRQSTHSNQALEVVDDLKDQWLEKHGDIVWVSYFVHVLSQLSSSLFFAELQAIPSGPFEQDDVGIKLYALQCVLLSEFSVQVEKGFNHSADETFSHAIALYSHVLLMIDQLLEQQSVALSVNHLLRFVTDLIDDWSTEMGEESVGTVASLLIDHSKTFYSISHCDRLLAALSEFPISSTEAIKLPFLSEWRDVLLADASHAICSTSPEPLSSVL